MALDKSTLETTIANGVKDIDLQNQDVAAEIAKVLANAIDTFVKGATVTVASGIPVSTTGTSTAQTGATTATGSATIS